MTVSTSSTSRYTDALAMADRMLIFRLMAKHVARTLGCFASFMPKPFQASFGSGAHLNVSLADVKTGQNLFDDCVSQGTAANATAGATGLSFLPTSRTTRPTARRPTCSPGRARARGRADGRAVPDREPLQAADATRGLMQEISWAPVCSRPGAITTGP